MTQVQDGPAPQTTIVQIIRPQHDLARWQPEVGPETIALLEHTRVPVQSRSRIVQEAVDILSRCQPPTEGSGQVTGLVVGYVQSGKTMSFTTVAALARDNKYRLVIIIAGTSVYLLEQSRWRLLNDLRLNDRMQRRPWRHVPNPSVADNNHRLIRDILAEWDDPDVPPSERRTVLITVMKQHGYLQNLIAVLQSLDLARVPTLIIDDEGDQAGLNTLVRRGGRSTTYRRLLECKRVIPHHSYLQYTATPQAPLLINIIDVLSPTFAEVITPGEGYTGGREFFIEDPNLVRLIPTGEIPSQTNQLNGPPASLLQAIRLFLLGATAHIVTNDPSPNRSMMVHPSRLVFRHGQYHDWVSRAIDEWKRILGFAPNDPARADLLDFFRRDYEDLRTTEASLPAFDLLVPRLRHSLLRTNVRPINRTPSGLVPINWNDAPYWILVGGQALDRGFTVEGLTVTYMPRGTGLGIADTIQQRARFFGYKRGYQGLCRIFLEASVNDAFREYVVHEEDIRSQLVEHRATGRPLSEWRRQFFLTRNLRPTRDAVIDINYNRAIFGTRWVYPEGPHDSLEAIEANRSVFQSFRQLVNFAEHDGLDRRATSHRNLLAKAVRLSLVHSELLTRLRVRRPEDSQLIAGLLRLIQFYLFDHADDVCTVFLMSGGHPIRRAYENDKIKELFQGVQYDALGETYPGDRALRDETKTTVQLRYLTLGELNQPPIAENVPHVAVWVPANVAKDMVQQRQGG